MEEGDLHPSLAPWMRDTGSLQLCHVQGRSAPFSCTMDEKDRHPPLVLLHGRIGRDLGAPSLPRGPPSKSTGQECLTEHWLLMGLHPGQLGCGLRYFIKRKPISSAYECGPKQTGWRCKTSKGPERVVSVYPSSHPVHVYVIYACI